MPGIQQRDAPVDFGQRTDHQRCKAPAEDINRNEGLQHSWVGNIQVCGYLRHGRHDDCCDDWTDQSVN
ncbi:unnamed protein product [Aspergillus oryzae var. brunneus]|uniref:Unnamed protein product n=1 Tax=Aspergillus oryzae var. brunneus TaxID=332754 RepID=A0ABQ6KPI6_ASPOZ|nr:unnamed protein product [Aspergillus oryzae]GMG47204.1 unnamed protein product [Aspergillus oryzae var. brunneus]